MSDFSSITTNNNNDGDNNSELQYIHQNNDIVNNKYKLKYSTTSTIFAQQSITYPDRTKLLYRQVGTYYIVCYTRKE